MYGPSGRSSPNASNLDKGSCGKLIWRSYTPYSAECARFGRIICHERSIQYGTPADVGAYVATAGASDLHFEPFEQELRIRMRVDGVLWPEQTITDQRRRTRLMELIKRECGFNLGKIGEPQDARFSTETPCYDYRAALVPVMGGEKIVLRFLQRQKQFDLATYPMRDDAKADLRMALSKRDGLIVVSGPTGSGKSTLLYNALSAINRNQLNVVTIEDPVEYRLDGVSQSQVHRHKGVGFAALLRSFMRADPDVILVGEIRDQETATAALHAAATGHLVATTVHANSSAEIATRLEGLGISPALYRANLRFASAQRLVGKNCPHCRVPDERGAQLVSAMLGEQLMPQIGRGCEACQGRGILGRVLLFEWISRVGTQLQGHDTLAQQALQFLEVGDVSAHAVCGY